MKTYRLAASLTLAASVGCLPQAKGAGFSLFSRIWGNAVVVTDMTPAGRALTPPTPARPVYYRGQSLGCELGSIPGDHLPVEKTLALFAAKVLAKQGYLGATDGTHEPALFLVIQWGYMRPRGGELLWFLGHKPSDEIAPIPTFATEIIYDYASDPIYGIIVTAFEFKSASTSRPIVYWQTRIGLPAIGKSMTQALPTMILAAGPTIGRETISPVLCDADNAREGRVEIGELKVLGYYDPHDTPNPASGAEK